ncbi:hypothetical protein KPL71_027274 [Citrus sinensis]|uniref:Uncharacterized protein n=1 Tax=Citrus sinensis TaxID=2711 RepID=A0ACB8I608_CITSI|nr:hypothetical protein KPL71_027274 [Citrus sinensis]
MRALLVHQGIEEVLEDPRTSKKISKVKDKDIQETMDKAHSIIILSLRDGVLREVRDQTTVAGLWKKLEDLYTKKSLTKRLNINIKIEDEDKVIILLSSLAPSYEYFVDTLLYGRQYLAMQDVKEALSSKESSKKSKTRDGEGLTEGHFKRDFPERKIKHKDANNRNGNAVIASEDSDEGYDYVGVLVASNMQTEGTTITGDIGVVENQEQDKTLLWNFRLGHVSESGLKELEKQGALGSDKISIVGFYEECVLRKSSRTRFKTVVHNTKDTLDYIHSDLWGPAQIESLGGVCYFLSMIDDFSRMGKLEPRALKCAFLGYPSGTKDYKLWCVDLKPPKCIISRDVIFNEFDMLKSQTSSQSIIQKIPRAETPHFEVELTKTEDASQEVDREEPKTYEEGVASKESAQWIKAMEDEMDSLNKNGTWKLIQKPEGRKVVGCKWVYKIKDGIPNVEPKRFKVSKSMKLIDLLKQQLRDKFDMKDLGQAKKILGVEMIRNRTTRTLFLSQEKYVNKVLEKFGMLNCKPVSTPMAAHFRLLSQQCPSTKSEQTEMLKTRYASSVGCLMYAMVLTRPDLSYAVSLVSRFMSNPGKEHWRAVKWILSCTISWKASLQSVVALSTTEAKYMAAAEAFKEALWLRGMVNELGDIAVPAKSVDRNELRVPQRYTVPRLLEGWINQKACKDHGYFLSVTKSKSIDKEGPTVNGPGVVSFPCGPMKYALMSPRRMPTYRHVSGKKSFFSNDQQPKIGNGVVVQFLVTAVRWSGEGRNLKREYLVFGRAKGESI